MKRQLLKRVSAFLCVLALVVPASAQTKQQEKVQKSTEILNEFKNMKESIPEQLIQQAEGIVIIPSMINAGLGIGGKRGKGVAMVKNADGNWSDPLFVTLTGGSIGFQAGVQAVDLVLVFKNRATLADIGQRKFSLGGDASVAAGPVGRNATASTDEKLDAEVYSYSRSKGLFAGITLNGTVLDVDKEFNTAFYGKNVKASSVLSTSSTTSQSSVKDLKESLNSF